MFPLLTPGTLTSPSYSPPSTLIEWLLDADGVLPFRISLPPSEPPTLPAPTAQLLPLKLDLPRYSFMLICDPYSPLHPPHPTARCQWSVQSSSSFLPPFCFIYLPTIPLPRLLSLGFFLHSFPFPSQFFIGDLGSLRPRFFRNDGFPSFFPSSSLFPSGLLFSSFFIHNFYWTGLSSLSRRFTCQSRSHSSSMPPFSRF